MIQLGNRVKDKITGFEGIAIAKVEYLNGCIQFCVKPKMTKKGEMPDGQYIDDMQLGVIDDGFSVEKQPDGGPMPDTPPTRYGTTH